ncbi:hypothetical protein [Neorickettsia findlayensis]|uniref:Uncharacterized protein n=1 Tax=Neorickettsia findlayensis TaxID=2686014 RepID=A0A6P1G9Z3_9RICK|nr:hypothetical protein [Neorickettsia findlayensis]QHD65297.1 hypothetical protein GP480_02450 [Neorickettsia findlayensis]
MQSVRYAPFLTGEFSEALYSIAQISSLLIRAIQQRRAPLAEQQALLEEALALHSEFAAEQSKLKELGNPDRREIVKCRDGLLKCLKQCVKHIKPNENGTPPLSRKKAAHIADMLQGTCFQFVGTLAQGAPHLPKVVREILSVMLLDHAGLVQRAVNAETASELATIMEDAVRGALMTTRAAMSGHFVLALEQQVATTPGLTPTPGHGHERERALLYDLLTNTNESLRQSVTASIHMARPNLEEEVAQEMERSSEEQQEVETSAEQESSVEELTSDERAEIETDPEMPPLEGSEEDLSADVEAQATEASPTEGAEQEESTPSEPSTPEDQEVSEILYAAEKAVTQEDKKATPDPEQIPENKKRKLATKRAVLPSEKKGEEEKQRTEGEGTQTPGFLDSLLLRALDLAGAITRTLLNFIQQVVSGEFVRRMFQRSSSSEPESQATKEGQDPQREQSAQLKPDTAEKTSHTAVPDPQASTKSPKTFTYERTRLTRSFSESDLTKHSKPATLDELLKSIPVQERVSGKGTQEQATSKGDRPIPPPPPLPDPIATTTPEVVVRRPITQEHRPSPVDQMMVELQARLQAGSGLKPATPRAPSPKAIERQIAPTPREQLMQQLSQVLAQRSSRSPSPTRESSSTPSPEPCTPPSADSPAAPSETQYHTPTPPSPETIPVAQLAVAAAGLEGVKSHGTAPEGSVKAPGTGGTDVKPESPQR